MEWPSWITEQPIEQGPWPSCRRRRFIAVFSAETAVFDPSATESTEDTEQMEPQMNADARRFDSQSSSEGDAPSQDSRWQPRTDNCPSGAIGQKGSGVGARGHGWTPPEIRSLKPDPCPRFRCLCPAFPLHYGYGIAVYGALQDREQQWLVACGRQSVVSRYINRCQARMDLMPLRSPGHIYG
jgi:hypothetical protein